VRSRWRRRRSSSVVVGRRRRRGIGARARAPRDDDDDDDDGGGGGGGDGGGDGRGQGRGQGEIPRSGWARRTGVYAAAETEEDADVARRLARAREETRRLDDGRERDTRWIDASVEMLETIRTTSDEKVRARTMHALARACEDAERAFEKECGADSSSSRAARSVLVRIQEMTLSDAWIDSVVERAVGGKMFTCTMPEQAAALRLLRACGLGMRNRDFNRHAILPFDDSTREMYCTILAELAFDGRAYTHSIDSRANDERARGPTPNLDAHRIKTYATGVLGIMLITDIVASDSIRNGVMESLLKPLVKLVVENGEGAPEWEMNSIEITAEASAADEATANDEGCPGGLRARDCDELHRVLMQSRLACVAAIGDYVECFAEALQHGVLDLSLRLVAGPHRAATMTTKSGTPEDNVAASTTSTEGWPKEFAVDRVFGQSGNFHADPQLPEALGVVSAFLAHRKFAVTFIESGGAKMLMNIPRGPMTYFGLTRCMFGIASITTALERLMAPPVNLARKSVKMALELLDCPNEFARRHAALYLTFAVQIPIVVVAFDAEAGLKLVLRILRTTAFFVSDEDHLLRRMSLYDHALVKETGDHLSLLLRQYMRAHFTQHVKALEEKVAGKSKKNSSAAPPPTPMNDASKLSQRRAMFQAIDIGQDATERMFSVVHRNRRVAAALQTKPWLVVEAFAAQNGPKVMLDLLQVAPGDKNLRECVIGSLSVLKIVTLHPSGRVATSAAQFREWCTSAYVLIDIIESAAKYVDTDAVLDALKVLCNLVAPPPALSNMDALASNYNAKDSNKLGKLPRAQSVDGKTFSVFDYHRMEETFAPARKHVQEARGVKSLLNLLFKTSKTLPQPARDITRALCCRTLLGLSRDAAISHTLQTLQIARHLSELVRETGKSQALMDMDTNGNSKREGGLGSAAAVEAAASEFHRCAVDLIVATAGFANVKTTTPAIASEAAAPPLAKLERHLIAAATKVRYPHEELLQVIHEHLVSAGLSQTAASLLNEARLDRLNSAHSGNASRFNSPAVRLKLNFKNKAAPSKLYRRAPRSRMTGAARGMIGNVNDPFTLGLDNGSLEHVMRKELSGEARTVVDKSPTLAPRGQKRKGATTVAGEELRKTLVTPPITGASGKTCCDQHHTPSPAMKERIHVEYPTPGMIVADAPRGETGCGVRSRLDAILTQYLRAQHRQCAAPITACAPFSLLTPHQCPKPRHVLDAPRNLTTRLFRREWSNNAGWSAGTRRADRHFVYSRFRPLRTMRGDDVLLTSVAFLNGISEHVIAGTNDGDIRLFDMLTSELIMVKPANDGAIRKITPTTSKCPRSMFLCDSIGEVSLWTIENVDHDPELLFTESAFGGAMNSVGSSLAVITEDEQINLIDITTRAVTRTLTLRTGGPPDFTVGNEDLSFSPNDELLLRDETLWDLRMSGNTPVQRFDRFSEAAGACFHPAGNEIIIGREVWDIRSSRLLRTVPSLNRAALKFNNEGSVGLAHIRHPTSEPPLAALRRCHHPYKHSFCTIDMTDYSDICTVDVDRGMMDAAWDMNTDTLCATVEYDIMDTHESIVRIFEVGRLRPTEDESDVEDEDGRHDGMFNDDMDYNSEDYGEDDYDEEDYDDDDDDGDDRRGNRPIDIDQRRVARTAADGLRTLLGRGDNADDWAHYDEYSDYDSDYGSSEDDEDEDSIDGMYEDDYFGVAAAGDQGRRHRGARDARIRIGDPNGDFNIDLARQPRRRGRRSEEEEEEEEEEESGSSDDDDDDDDMSSEDGSGSSYDTTATDTSTSDEDEDEDEDEDDNSEWETDTDGSASGDWADDADHPEFGDA